VGDNYRALKKKVLEEKLRNFRGGKDGSLTDIKVLRDIWNR
jgi:hypothetical protein